MYPDDSLTLHTDLYQINMMQVYFRKNIHNKRAVFEVYFRKEPFHSGYSVFAGLERMIHYLNHLTFSESDIAYLRSLSYDEENEDRQFKIGINSTLCTRGRLGLCQ